MDHHFENRRSKETLRIEALNDAIPGWAEAVNPAITGSEYGADPPVPPD
jgi:hypothetical protein